MATTPQINQGKVDDGAEISPDGGIITQTAQPMSRQTPPEPREQPTTEEPTVEEQPVVEEQPKTDDLDFTAFLKIKDEVKEEPKEEPEIKVEPEVKPTELKTTQQQKFPAQRDYSDIDESDIPLFKQMHNESFAKLKPVYIAHKKQIAEIEQLKKQVQETQDKPASIYEHENGFILTPEFSEASKTISLANQIHNHWRTQLQKVLEGAEEYEHIELNDKGKFVTSKIKATNMSADEIRENLAFTQNQAMQAQVELNTIVRGHNEKYTSARNQLNNFMSQSFSFFETPEAKRDFEPQISQVINALPPAFRANPLSVPFAKALITIKLMGMQKQQTTPVTQQKSALSTAKQAQQRRAGPTNTGLAAGGSSGGEEPEITFDAFERVKQGL
jgi:hypothetical protein